MRNSTSTCKPQDRDQCEIAKGMSDLRDALKAMTELAETDCSVSALAPYLRQAWSGADRGVDGLRAGRRDGLGRRKVARPPVRRLIDRA